MKKLWDKMKSFRPPLIFSCILALLFSTSALVSVTTAFGKKLPAVVLYGVYACAAIFLSLAVWAIILFCKKAPPGKRLKELAHRLDFTGQSVDNCSFRTVTFTYASLALNVCGVKS